MARAKIICTIGPASCKESVLRNMILAGMDVARLNFSHGTHEDHLSKIISISRLNKKLRRHIRILEDLEGHRIRVGRIGPNGVELKKGKAVYLTNEAGSAARSGMIPFDYEGDLRDIKRGNFIYIDDGNIALLVKTSSAKEIKAEVAIGGMLKENKGVNIPDAKLKFSAITTKDRSDIVFGIKNRVDYIAQSFVRNKEDIIEVRDIVGSLNADCGIIAKIENREGIRNIDEIIRHSDGIMIARGDMGVSIPIYEIPIVQKEIIKRCNRARKFVITATQMLESMTDNLRPTRAEVTDVANAIIDGSDFLMLSGETAVGRHPSKVVEMMNQIIKFTESHI